MPGRVHLVVIALRLLLPLLGFVLNAYPFAELTPASAIAFDGYVERAESRMSREPGFDARMKAKLQGGEVKIEAVPIPDDLKTPGAMIQDWRGTMFIPHTTIAQVKSVLQDYAKYKDFYKPEVIDSKQLGNKGDEFDIFLRLRKQQVLTVVLNTEYHVRYNLTDPRRLSVVSRSTRIAEVSDPDKSLTDENPVGNDSGFLWRLNSYWRFEEGDGGVYAQCEAISLSRDVPLGLAWMIKGFISKFPRESMQNTLRGTKAAVEAEARK